MCIVFPPSSGKHWYVGFSYNPTIAMYNQLLLVVNFSILVLICRYREKYGVDTVADGDNDVWARQYGRTEE